MTQRMREYVVVLAMVGLVVLVVVPAMMQRRAVAERPTPTDPTAAAIRLVDTGLMGVIALYRTNTGVYPRSLSDLTKQPADPVDGWKGPYIEHESHLRDPWGTPLRYHCPGRNNKHAYDLWSCGPDGKNGTPDDIGNWITPRDRTSGP